MDVQKFVGKELTLPLPNSASFLIGTITDVKGKEIYLSECVQTTPSTGELFSCDNQKVAFPNDIDEQTLQTLLDKRYF